MTPQEMLTEIVQRGVDGGAFKEPFEDKNWYCKIQYISKGEISIVKGYCKDGKVSRGDIKTKVLSLADLINDNRFMAVTMGDEEMAYYENINMILRRYQYIQMLAIIIDNPQDQVRFLYDSMEGRE